MENGARNSQLVNGTGKRKAATNASINLTKKNSNLRRVRNLLHRKKSYRKLSEDDEEFLITHSDLVKQFYKRQEKRAELLNRQVEHEDLPEDIEEKCLKLAQAIHDAQFLVVYTGAGISTAASIPDYRGPNGIWTRLQKGKDIGTHDLTTAEPTLTHMALSHLYNEGIVHHIVSQNCDGLHLRSGLPKTALSEVHGNMYIEVCKHCSPTREFVRIFDVTERTSKFNHTTGRRCYRCGEPLIDTIVHFGERGKLRWPLNWQGACQAANACDTILCLGSSLKVLRKYPWLWQMDRPLKKRPHLFIVNLQWTPKDKEATLKINGKCDDVMAIVMKKLHLKIPQYVKIEDPIFNMSTVLHPEEASTVSGPSIELPRSRSNSPEQSYNSGEKLLSALLCKEEKFNPPLSSKIKIEQDISVKSEVKNEWSEIFSFPCKVGEVKEEIDEKLMDCKSDVKEELVQKFEVQVKEESDEPSLLFLDDIKLNCIKSELKDDTKIIEVKNESNLSGSTFNYEEKNSAIYIGAEDDNEVHNTPFLNGALSSDNKPLCSIKSLSHENGTDDYQFVSGSHCDIAMAVNQSDSSSALDDASSLNDHVETQEDNSGHLSPKEEFYGTGLCVRSSCLSIHRANEDSFDDLSSSSQYSDNNSEIIVDWNLVEDKNIIENCVKINPQFCNSPRPFIFNEDFNNSGSFSSEDLGDQTDLKVSHMTHCKDREEECKGVKHLCYSESIKGKCHGDFVGVKESSDVQCETVNELCDKERECLNEGFGKQFECAKELFNFDGKNVKETRESADSFSSLRFLSSNGEEGGSIETKPVGKEKNCNIVNLTEDENLFESSHPHEISSDFYVDISTNGEYSDCDKYTYILHTKLLRNNISSPRISSSNVENIAHKVSNTKKENSGFDSDLKSLWYRRFCQDGIGEENTYGKDKSEDCFRNSTELDDDVKRLWFWGFDSKSVESPRRLTRSSYQKALSERGTTDFDSCKCLTKNSELCKFSRDNPPIQIIDESIEKARRAIKRRREVNYKRFEPVFTVELENITYERKKIRRSKREDFESDDDPDIESDLEEESTIEPQKKVTESKIVPGWYGKGYKKFLKRKKSYP